MPSFNISPTSEISVSGWVEESDSVQEDLSPYPFTSDESTVDENGNAATFGGASLPADFPSTGVDSVSYQLRMRVQDTKPNILPDMKVQVLTSSNAEIATVTVSLGGSPTAQTTYSGSMSVTGNNTDTDWTNHRIRLTPQRNATDSDFTDFEVEGVRLVATYTEEGEGGGGDDIRSMRRLRLNGAFSLGL